ncbi:hypothetical protein SFUMM280S_10785 [Streptomyces fumanus]
MTLTASEPGPPPWRLLLGYVRPHRWTLLGGAVLSLLTGATGLLLPLVARGLIDDLSHDRAIAGALLAMTALVVVNAVVGALGAYVLRRTAESVVLGARRALSSYLLRLRIAAVDRTEPGDLMARITSDTTLLRGPPPGRPVGRRPAHRKGLDTGRRRPAAVGLASGPPRDTST